MNPAISMAMGSTNGAKIYVDDVFSVYPYTGTGAIQNIVNGINTSGKGGLVWVKPRGSNASGIYGSSNHLIDTNRGLSVLKTNDTSAQSGFSGSFTSFNNDGFTIPAGSSINAAGEKYNSWSFREASNFLDVVSYTGNGSTSANISHSLGSAPGMIVIKNLSTGAWYVYHRENSTGTNNYLVLNTTAASVSSTDYFSAVSSTTFAVSSASGLNTNAANYVAYVFGHSGASDGLIQCRSFTADGSGNVSIQDLGWEPQFIMVKAISTTGDWIMLDNIRGWDTSTTDAKLLANSNGVETSTDHGEPTSVGFNFKGGTASAAYIFMAIRRSNKPPATGTQVFSAAARTGTGATSTSASSGFPVDLFITKKQSSTTLTGAKWFDRIRGKTINFDSSSNSAEATTADSVTAMDSMNGVTFGVDATVSAFNTSGHTYIDYFFKRAAGVLDIVQYTGTGATHTEPHGLGVVPEMMIIKARTSLNWFVYHSAMGATKYLNLNGAPANANTDTTIWNSTAPTSSVFTVGTLANSVNNSTTKYIAWLLATVSGVSKVGSFTGNGSSQDVDCGFTAGARFVMAKRLGATDWYAWDSTRGIIAGNDPHISMNTTAAEVTTDDSIDPLAAGFTINQVAGIDANLNGATYIYLAIA